MSMRVSSGERTGCGTLSVFCFAKSTSPIGGGKRADDIRPYSVERGAQERTGVRHPLSQKSKIFASSPKGGAKRADDIRPYVIHGSAFVNVGAIINRPRGGVLRIRRNRCEYADCAAAGG